MGVEGSPALHLAVACGGLAGRAGGAAAAVAVLVGAGASPYSRDDTGRTPLHWAAALDLEAVVVLLLQAGVAEAARVEAEAAAAAADAAAAAEAEGAPLPPPAAPARPPPLTDIADRQSNTALHLAAKAGAVSVVAALLAAATDAAAAARARNKAGCAPLHLAASAGAGATAAALLNAVPDVADVRCRRGRSPGEWAERGGAGVLAAALSARDAAAAAAAPPPGADTPPLLVLAPDECLAHRTAPEPITRAGAEPPPENVGRLTVLTSLRTGVLRGPPFSSLAWHTAPRRASAPDVLRVHEWSYVRRLQAACAGIPDDPAAVGHLDGDTAVCAASFDAALVAAGAVCDAVDAVLDGRAAGAFCAVRPPGHHAGPTGVTPCANDPAGSHGFCLLNNVAIGAAYALATRPAEVRRVAILDFDVHHGNGTQACVAGVVPSIARVPSSTPYSDSVTSFPTFKPWAGWDDAGAVLFASVQGYGPKEASAPAAGWVYPGTGGTCDTGAPGEDGGGGDTAAGAMAVDHAPPAAANGDAPPSATVPEDPDGEFAPDPAVEAPPPPRRPPHHQRGHGPRPRRRQVAPRVARQDPARRPQLQARPHPHLGRV